jgi:alpha-N-arabinofuranosidase
MTARVRVDLGRELGRVDPKIYGQFLSRRRWVAEDALHQPGHPDAGEDGIRRTVAKAVEEMAPPVIRWPGGCTGTSYEWQHGVGDPATRSRTVDWHFGYDVGNGFGTAEFVRFCRDVGAEPQINLTTGTGTLREALAWLEYANGRGPSHWAQLRRSHGYDEPFDVRYWQIGNEDWGEWEIGRVTAEENARRCREWARALHKLKPRVDVLAVGAWRHDVAVDWNLALLREAWDDLDYLTVHTYWRFDPELPDGDYDRLIGATVAEEDGIVALRGLIELVGREKRSTRRPLLAFTEWNCANLRHKEMTPEWRPGRTQYRMLDALVVASFLNVLQRQSATVGLANFAQTINVVGALVVDQEHVVREAVYWPLWMQRHHSGPIAVDALVSAPTLECAGQAGERIQVPVLDVSATRSDDGRTLWLSVVNRDREQEHHLALDVAGATPTAARTCLLAAEDLLARNTVEHPDAVSARWVDVADVTAPLVVPPGSYAVTEIDLAGR